jgi:hypothetical protein
MTHDSYLKIVGVPRQMGGKGAPTPTIFGVLGHTKDDSYMKSLGGLVMTKTKGRSENPTKGINRVVRQTDHHLEGAGHATAVSGAHYGQVPYAGQYMKSVGSKV